MSGYYVARLLTSAGAATVPFVVRPPADQRSAVLVQVPVNTWDAYNPWGGKSLYDFNSTDLVRANHVSLDRPYAYGAQGPFEAELQLVRFLEREGVDVPYQTDVDTHRDPGSLLTHRLVMTAGHDEYWTKEMRDAFDAARDAGTNLAFMGSNTGYWQVRYADGERTIVGYKNAAADPISDPALKTVQFRELGRPKCELEGVMFLSLRPHESGEVDYTVTQAATTDPWLAGSGFVPGDVVKGVVENEWDALPVPMRADCSHPGLTVLFHYEAGGLQNADAVRYTAPSGARVFASGAYRFSWGLDTWGTTRWGHTDPADPRLQQFMRNALADLTTPVPPSAYRIRVRKNGRAVNVAFRPPTDPRIDGVLILRHAGAAAFATNDPGVVRVCTSATGACVDRIRANRRRIIRYAAVAIDRWGQSAPLLSVPIRLVPGRSRSG